MERQTGHNPDSSEAADDLRQILAGDISDELVNKAFAVQETRELMAKFRKAESMPESSRFAHIGISNEEAMALPDGISDEEALGLIKFRRLLKGAPKG
jgi:hypothetical protein